MFIFDSWDGGSTDELKKKFGIDGPWAWTLDPETPFAFFSLRQGEHGMSHYFFYRA